ncbi:MAG: VWA domain-containing protein [Pirellulales bacterium]
MWQNCFLAAASDRQSLGRDVRAPLNIFLDEAGKFSQPPKTALVTWSTDYDLPITPYTSYSKASTDLLLPSDSSFVWATNAAAIQSSINGRSQLPIAGGTNLSAGLDMAVATLKGTNSSQFANKVVVLLTDGQWNEGRSPIDAAYDARAAGVTVHCVSMLTSSQPDLQSVADITGGRYYGTTNETQLRNAFAELARSLPIVLTQ